MCDGKARLLLSKKKSRQQCSPVLCFARFQSHLFFDKVPETVSDMLVGTYMEKNTLSINCVFLIPWWRSLGVGIGSILGTAALR